MKGRYAGVSMGTYGAILPGAARLARLPAEPSSEAKRRLKILQWCEEHGGQVRLTARHHGLSPDTVSRWLRAYRASGLGGLASSSRRPKRVRQPTTSTEVVLRIQALRERYPRWGREKLRVLLAREGIAVSAKTVDRTIARLKARGALREPVRLAKAKARRARQERLRRPRDLVVDAPGVLVQLDTKYVPLGKGKTAYEFAGVDYFTRKRVVGVAPRLNSEQAAAFLRHLLVRFPFPVQAIQSDGGAEFMKDFSQAAAELGLVSYVNRPNYPQGNGRVERAFRTDEEEFYQVEEWPAELGGLEASLQAWNHVYETVRPHQALGYLTPDEFYARWLQQQHFGKEAVSDMS
jgi:putative transposase